MTKPTRVRTTRHTVEHDNDRAAKKVLLKIILFEDI